MEEPRASGDDEERGVDGAVGRSRANHVPGAISDSRTTRTSTPAKSVPSPSSQEFGSGALVEVDRPRGNSTTAQAMANKRQHPARRGPPLGAVRAAAGRVGGPRRPRRPRRHHQLHRQDTDPVPGAGSLPARGDSSGDALGTKGGTNDCGGAGAAARGMITDPDASSSMDSLSCDWDDPLEPTRRPLLSYEDVGEAAFGANGETISSRGFIHRTHRHVRAVLHPGGRSPGDSV